MKIGGLLKRGKGMSNVAIQDMQEANEAILGKYELKVGAASGLQKCSSQTDGQ